MRPLEFLTWVSEEAALPERLLWPNVFKPRVHLTCFRRGHVLPLESAGRREARLCYQEAPGNPDCWAQAVGRVSGEGNTRNLVEKQTFLFLTSSGQCEHALVLALVPRWATATWQGRASLWLTWLSILSFPTSSSTSMLTRWDVFSLRGGSWNHATDWVSKIWFNFLLFVSPLHQSASSMRLATPTWQLTTIGSKTGPVSRPPGLPPGLRTPREWSWSKTSEEAPHCKSDNYWPLWVNAASAFILHSDWWLTRWLFSGWNVTQNCRSTPPHPPLPPFVLFATLIKLTLLFCALLNYCFAFTEPAFSVVCRCAESQV